MGVSESVRAWLKLVLTLEAAFLAAFLFCSALGLSLMLERHRLVLHTTAEHLAEVETLGTLQRIDGVVDVSMAQTNDRHVELTLTARMWPLRFDFSGRLVQEVLEAVADIRWTRYENDVVWRFAPDRPVSMGILLMLFGPLASLLAGWVLLKLRPPPRLPTAHWTTSRLAGVTLAASIGILVANMLVSALLPGDEDFAQALSMMLRDPASAVLVVLAAVVVAPVGEELLFRGWLLRWLAARGFAWANLVQAALFALMHMSAGLATVVFTMLLGLVAGRLVLATGRLTPAIWLHLVNNLYATIVLYLLPASAG